MNAMPPGPLHLHFEGIGTITLPHPQTLAFLGGVGVLVAIGMIEWPIAALFVVARLFAGSTKSATLRGLAEALAIAH
ncbi:hypothetical protein AB6813_15950 [bacterium RCC_150]